VRRTRNSLSAKISIAAYLILLTVFPALPALARSHTHSARQETTSDPGYVLALAAANHFLHAWQTGDLENGTVLLSDNLRHTQNADQLEQLFSNATGRAFEIARGHGYKGRYSFPVVLVTLRGSHAARRFSEIVLADTGKNDWVVDKLP
jgi:hypothetical protein